MEYERFIAIEDLDDSSDYIGNNHVLWDGPHTVYITDSICEFFNVENMDEITQEMFNAAKLELYPVPVKETLVRVSITMVIRHPSNINPLDVVEELDYSLVSNTEGAIIASTHFHDAEELKYGIL